MLNCRRTIFLSLSFALLAACSGSHKATPLVDLASQPVLKDAISELPGAWVQRGTGLALEITGDTFTAYRYTRATCATQYRMSLEEAGELLVDVREEREGAALSLLIAGEPEFHRMTFSQQDSLPANCEDAVVFSHFDPEFSFEHFWHIFNDYYAFFDLRGVDWDQLYQTMRPQVTAATSESQLFALMATMLAPLNDGQVSLEADSASFSDYHSSEKNRGYEQYAQSLEVYEGVDSDQAYQFLIRGFNRRLEYQLGGGDLQRHLVDDENKLSWGILDNNTGYLQINAMEGFTSDGTTVEDLAAVENLMSEVMAKLKFTDHLIVDVRFNTGGYDAVALAIASRFAGEARIAYRKQSYDKGALSAPQDFTVSPHEEGSYLNKITLITGPNTASAAEIFTYAMRSLPHVKHIGEATNGIHSDSLEVEVAAGWQVSLSNQVYLAPDGSVYEASGIPPELEVPVTSILSLSLSVFPAISHALKDGGLNAHISQQEFELELDAALGEIGIPGFSVAWISDEEFLGHYEYGYADIAEQRLVSPNTAFTIGSISKTLIGTSIAQAIEEQHFSLDTPVVELNPDIALDSPFGDLSALTMRHLVTHSSSINDNDVSYNCGYYLEADHSSLAMLFDEEADCPEPVATEQGDFLASYLSQQGNLFDGTANYIETTPGEYYNYSNVGAALAANTLAVATGTAFDSWTEQRIFEPLGMSQTHWFDRQYTAEQEMPARRYLIDGNELIELPRFQLATWSDGGLKSSPTDLARYLLAIAKGGELAGQRILNAASVADMLRSQDSLPTVEEGGHGIFWENDGNIIGHNGGDPGTVADMRYDQFNKVGYVFMYNGTPLDEDVAASGGNVFDQLTNLMHRRAMSLRRESYQ